MLHLKKMVSLLGVMCVGIILSGCRDQAEQNETDFPVGGGMLTCSRLRGAVGVGIHEENNPELIDYDGDFFQINLSTPQDEIVISVFNACYVERPFLLKVFYNYEEVPFRVADANEYDTVFLFELVAQEQINIPIQLSSELEADDYLNILTVGAFPNPEHLAMNDDGTTINNMFATMFNFAVSYGGNSELSLGTPFQDAPMQIEVFANAFKINQSDVELILEHGAVFTMINEFLQVTPGEVVELYFYVNTMMYRDSTVTEYLLVSMLDWQQIDKNGQPFLLFEAREDDMRNGLSDRGIFTVTMPEEPGFYEFVTFIVPNPTDIHHDIHNWDLIFAFPFTVEVVAE